MLRMMSWIVLFTALACVPCSHADVTLSNLDAPLAPGSIGLGQSGSLQQIAAVGIRNGPERRQLDSVRVRLNTSSGSAKTITGRIYAGDLTRPTVPIGSFRDITIPANQSDAIFALEPSETFILEPNTVYYFSINALTSLAQVTWSGTVTDPETDANTSYLGYRISTDLGANWSTISVIVGSAEVRTLPEPAATNLPASNPVSGTVLGNGRAKAVALTTASIWAPLDRVTVSLSNSGPSNHVVRASIYTNFGVNPDQLLATFQAVTVPANSGPREYEFFPTQPFTFPPNTTVWIVLQDDSPLLDVSWDQDAPDTLPSTIGTEFQVPAYRFSTNNGASWSNSTTYNAISISTRPWALIHNIPSTPGSFSTLLGSDGGSVDSTKAVGFTTDDSGYQCVRVLAIVNNLSSANANSIIGGVYRDAGGVPGSLVTAFYPFRLNAFSGNQTITLTPVDPFARLAPNSSYWVVLDGTDGPSQARWLTGSPDFAPLDRPGITYNGYLFSNSGGASWGGSSIYNGVAVEATALCICDVAPNGVLNLDDLDAFVDAFLSGLDAADIDGNGTANLDDLDLFVGCFLGGCP